MPGTVDGRGRGSDSGGRSVPAGNRGGDADVEGRGGSGRIGSAKRIVGGGGDDAGGGPKPEDEPSEGNGSGHSHCGPPLVEGVGELVAGGKLRGITAGGGEDGSNRKLPRLSGISGGGEVGNPGGGMVPLLPGTTGAPRNPPGAGVTVVVERPDNGFRQQWWQPACSNRHAITQPMIP